MRVLEVSEKAVTRIALPQIGIYGRTREDRTIPRVSVLDELNLLLGWLLFAVLAVLTLGIAWLLAFITRSIINAFCSCSRPS